MTVGERQATEPSWHERTPVVTAAGVAALVLVGLLIYAVLLMSDGSWGDPEIGPPPTATFEPSSVTGRTTSSTSTSYPRQSVQTSEPTLTPEAPPPPPVDVPAEPAPTPTTIYNPYTTTTTNNAGAV